MAQWRVHLDIEPPYLLVKPDMSERDFYRLADEDSNWEYLDGRVIMHSPASNRHEDLFSFLNFLLRGFLDERGGGAVRGSRYPMRLDARWSPEPDLLVVRTPRRRLMKERYLEGPADLVIEIASESDPRLDYREKLPRYRAAGIPEIWIVDRFQRQILIETKLARRYRSRTLHAGRLDSVVVQGFWIEVSWLWQKRLPSSLRCLGRILARG
jgi:Uma2 family endonuclease